MGKYRATMNVGGHRRGEVMEYEDGDPVLERRLAAGWVVPVDGVPRGTKPIPDVKPAPKKAAARKKKPVKVDAEEVPPVAEEPVAEPEEEPRVTFGMGVQTAFRSDSED